MILRETGLVRVAGVLIGVAAAAAVTQYVRTMLYGLEPMDPVAFGAAVAGDGWRRIRRGGVGRRRLRREWIRCLRYGMSDRAL
jgi:hypothetical protein